MAMQPVSPAGRILIGLFCIACGTPPVLSAFDIGPFSSADIHGPPWVGLVAGGIFIAVGISLMLSDPQRTSPATYSLLAFVMASLAALANWIAFGPGPRECTIAFAGLFFESGNWVNGFACRAGFGVGALLMDGTVLWMAARALRNILESPTLPDMVEKVAFALFLLALTPIFVPLLAFPIGRELFKGFLTWRRTGSWPRNEEFVARMKAKNAEKS